MKTLFHPLISIANYKLKPQQAVHAIQHRNGADYKRREKKGRKLPQN